MELYKLNEIYYNVFNRAIDTETGEILDDRLVEELELIKDAKELKVLNIACFIKSLLAESKGLKEEKKALETRARVCENKAAALKNYIQMNIREGEKIKDPRASLSWRKSTSVLIKCDIHDLPSIYQKIELSANKTEIKKSLQSGNDIAGCELHEKQNLQVK